MTRLLGGELDAAEGRPLGCSDGSLEGSIDSFIVGSSDGIVEGALDAAIDGLPDGDCSTCAPSMAALLSWPSSGLPGALFGLARKAVEQTTGSNCSQRVASSVTITTIERSESSPMHPPTLVLYDKNSLKIMKVSILGHFTMLISIRLPSQW